jgi:hypothetical protein
VGRAVSKKLGCESADDDWGGLNIKSVVQMGDGGMSGIITGDSESPLLDILEFEVARRTCGTQTGAA